LCLSSLRESLDSSWGLQSRARLPFRNEQARAESESEVPLRVAQLAITSTQPATHLGGVTGPIKSPSSEILPRASISTDESAKLAKFFSSAVPLGRWGEAKDVANAVLFLASDDSSYVNAVELMVDGGATGAPFGAPILRG
jgi:hypothetical protein